MVGNFGNSLLIQNAFHTDSALGNDEFVIGKGGLYPNPSTGIFHLASEYETKITVTDLAGKIVWSADKVTTQSTLDLSHLSKGIYLAQLENLQGSETVKIVLK